LTDRGRNDNTDFKDRLSLMPGLKTLQFKHFKPRLLLEDLLFIGKDRNIRLAYIRLRRYFRLFLRFSALGSGTRHSRAMKFLKPDSFKA